MGRVKRKVPPSTRDQHGPRVPLHRVVLTVGGAGIIINGDNEGRLLRDTACGHPAHVFARIGRRHLGDAQAGA